MVALNVRFTDEELHKDLAERALESYRTLNGEIMFRLRESLKADSKKRDREQSAA
jgi:hypothetical protein